MSKRKTTLGAGAVALLIAMSFSIFQVMAQTDPKPGTQPGMERGQRSDVQGGRSVTLQGKLVDLHTFMTEQKEHGMTGQPGTDRPGQPGADRPGADRPGANPDQPGAERDPLGGKSNPMDANQCSQRIRAGVPCALKTNTGLVILGKGERGAGNELAEHATKQITIRGQLFEREGLQYLDIETIEPQVAQRGTDRPGTTTP
jgi:hypothetical protein